MDQFLLNIPYCEFFKLPYGKTKFSDGLAPFRKMQNFGYIDRSGKLAIDTRYQWVKDFADGLAPVFIYKKWGYINRLGEMVIEAQFDSANAFHDGLALIKQGNAYCFINKNGKIVTTGVFHSAQNFYEGMAAVSIEEKMGYIDRNGKMIIKPTFYRAQRFSENLAAILIDDKWGYIDRQGEIVIKPQFTRADCFREGLAAVCLTSHDFRADVDSMSAQDECETHEGLEFQKKYCFGEWSYIDKNGYIAVKSKFDLAYSFCEGLAKVMINKKFGFLKKDGQLAIESKYNDARCFSEGLAAVKFDDTWGYIDGNGETVIEPLFDEAYSFSEGLAFAESRRRIYCIDKNGKVVLDLSKMYPDHWKRVRFDDSDKDDSVHRSYELGISQLKNRDYLDALVSFHEVIKKEPLFADARYHLGNTYLKLGNCSEAMKELKILEKLDDILADRLSILIYSSKFHEDAG